MNTMQILLVTAFAGVLLLTSSMTTTAGIMDNGDGTWTYKYTLSDADKAKVEDAFRNIYHYQDNITNSSGHTVPNPQSLQDFTDMKIEYHIRDVVKLWDKKQQMAGIDLNGDINIT